MEQSVPSDHPFDTVAEALRHGEDAAWRAVMDHFSKRLIGLARERIAGGRLPEKLDPEEVVQSVYRTFLRRHQRREFDAMLLSWDRLWGLLVYLTTYRCHQWERNATDQLMETLSPDRIAQPTDRDPTPQEATLLLDVLRQFLGTMEETPRRVVELGLLGMGDEEISREVGRSEYRVGLIREDFAEQLRDRLESENAT